MSVNVTAHQTVIGQLRGAVKSLEHYLHVLSPNAVASLLPPPVSLLAKVGLSKLGGFAKAGQQLLDVLNAVLEGEAAPVLMQVRAETWRELHVTMAEVAASLDAAEISTWDGSAAIAYAESKGRQAAAARGVGTMAGAIASALESCAHSGFLFYSEVALAVAAFLEEVAGDAAAAATVVGAPEAVGALGVEALKLVAEIGTAIAELEGELLEATSSLGSAEADAVGVVPGGHWPGLGADLGPTAPTAPIAPAGPGSSAGPGGAGPGHGGGLGGNAPGNVPAIDPTIPDPAGSVPIQPGDTLWDIARRHLGPHATNAQIAAEWPKWWAANRGLVGPDPNLILPGQALHPPVTPTTIV